MTVVALKGFKTLAAASEETTCFSATILVDGRRAGTASNDGRGGSHRYRWDDRAVGDAVEAWADSLDLEFAHEKLDQVVDRLAARELLRRDYARWCKGKTLYRLRGEARDRWRTLKGSPDERMRAHLRGTYGDRVERILNDDVAAAVDEMFPALPLGPKPAGGAP